MDLRSIDRPAGAVATRLITWSRRRRSRLSWRNVITWHAKARRMRRIDGPQYVVLELRRVDVPDRAERGDRVGFAPIDAQIRNRPRNFAHDQQTGRVNRPRLTAACHTG